MADVIAHSSINHQLKPKRHAVRDNVSNAFTGRFTERHCKRDHIAWCQSIKLAHHVSDVVNIATRDTVFVAEQLFERHTRPNAKQFAQWICCTNAHCFAVRHRHPYWVGQLNAEHNWITAKLKIDVSDGGKCKSVGC